MTRTPALWFNAGMINETPIKSRYDALFGILDERQVRLWAGAEANSLGYGGIIAVSRATGINPNTIRKGIAELKEIEAGRELPQKPQQRVRQPGGGRKKLTETDPSLLDDLNRLIDPVTRGDPECPLRWTSKSTYNLAEELRQEGHQISPRTVASLLQEQDYSLQAARKTKEGSDHPDRDAQFQHIYQQVSQFKDEKQPVISVDAKKKELVGNFKNGGQEWQPKGSPEKVNVHDFPDKMLGKAIPYGVFDIVRNEGYVSVGISHDTAEFAVQGISNWWQHMGKDAHPKATKLMITCDSGGSNGKKNRLWKAELQQFANETGLSVTVCHFPPGTSKWNKIEHQMFSYITKNWRGRTLISYEVIVSLIGSAGTSKGLRIQAELDTNYYEKGIQISEEEMESINIIPAEFHGEWNYTIHPHSLKVN